MSQRALLIAGAVAAALSTSAAMAADAGMEKCYGVAKAGKNDCKGGAATCAGSSTKDGEGFVLTPAGLCDKIVGGSTAEPAAE